MSENLNWNTNIHFDAKNTAIISIHGYLIIIDIVQEVKLLKIKKDVPVQAEKAIRDKIWNKILCQVNFFSSVI